MLDSLKQELRAVLKVPLYLVRARQIIVDNRFVIAIKLVWLRRVIHNFECFLEALLPNLEIVGLLICIYFFYRLLVQTCEQ